MLFSELRIRAVGGYETDRGTSCEDWEVFVKLIHAGKQIGVVPEHLFYYRHLVQGFSRQTNAMADHRRVLRQFTKLPGLPAGGARGIVDCLDRFPSASDATESKKR